VSEVTLELDRATFEEGKECLKDDLDQALVAKDAAETRIQVMTDQCQ